MLLLESDSAWVARRDAQDRKLAKRAAQARVEQAELVNELGRVGVIVDTVWDLVTTSDPYPAAIPILLRHLDRPYSDRTREGIGRALGTKAARPVAWDQLVAGLQDGSLQDGAGDGAMVAISAMASPSDLDLLCHLMREQSLGPRRILLVRNLTRSKRKEAKETLLALRDDPDLKLEIDRWLKNRRKQESQ